MAQQQAPAVGTVQDGYRFKGGDPSNEGSWEAVSGPEAAGFTPLGGGWYRGPDGGSYQEGRGGAMVKRSGGSSSTGGGSAPMVGADSRARFMLGIEPLKEAQAIMERMDAEGYTLDSDLGAAALEAVPFDGGYLARRFGGEDYNAYMQASKTFEAAILPIMSGAAVTNPEAARQLRASLPQPGDSQDVLAQKSRQRRHAINAIASGIGMEAPFDFGAAPEAGGLPTNTGTGNAPPPPGALPRATPTTQAIADGVFDGATIIERDGKPYYAVGLNPGQGAPADLQTRYGQDGKLTADEMIAAGYQPDEETGQWLFPVNMDRLPPNAGEGTGGPAPRGPQDDGGRAASQLGGFAAFQRGAMEQFPLADEAAAGLGALVTGTDYGDVRQAQRDLAQYDRDNNGLERNIGGVAGATAMAANPLGAPVRLTKGANLAGRVINRAAGGAALGGLWGFGQDEGNALERLDGAAGGATIGAAGGVGAPVVANALGRVAEPVIGGIQALNRTLARPVVNALGDRAPAQLREVVAPNPLRSGMNRFADRSRQQPDAMNTNALNMRAQEIEPTFADVVNDGGRGTLRALATRQTPARQAAREFADGRAAGLQDRISTQARRTISDDPRPPTEIRAEVGARRAAEGDQAFGAVRGEVIAPEREVIEALRAPALRPAIKEAATAALNRGDSETANMLRQLTDGALDNPNGVQITVGMADRLARALNGKAEVFQRAGNNDSAGAYFSLAERLRGSARQQVPGYDEALNAYAADSRLMSASELGEQFMSMEADQFASAVARLAPEERQIARAAARRAVERQAGTQGQAPGVAQRLSNGREQSARTEALVGDAQPVQQAMGAELQALRNAQGISPAQGSPTSMNAQDALGAAGAARDVATGNVLGLAGRAMNAIRSRGFSDQEAEAIVQAAINPAETSRLIEMLTQRMSRREARNLARAIRYQLTIAPQSGQQG